MQKLVRGVFCKKTVVAMLVAMAALSLAAPAFSQTTANGRISGTVKDQTGGAIIGAAVTVTDVARGLSRNLTTDQVGAYLAPNLLPGQYTVRATFAGFQAYERTNINLGVSQDLFIDVVLQPGATTTTVTITEDIPLVNTTSSTLGGTLTNQQAVDLPILARNYINLIELLPGTVMQLGNNSGGGGPATTNGLRAESSNSYAIEGLRGIDPYTGQSAVNNIGVNGDAASLLSPDAIQEFNQQVNSKAENGGKAGSNVSVGLRSGTNALHGTGYGYFRDNGLDALNYYNPYDSVGGVRTPIDINVSAQQFGGTLGGPIKRDKLFFFLSYEQLRLRNGNPRSINAFFTDPGMLSNYPTCLSDGIDGTCAANSGLFPNIQSGTGRPDAANHIILACEGIAPALRSPQSLFILGMAPDCSLPGGTSASGKSFAAGEVNPDFFINHGANDHGAQGPNNPLITTYYPNNDTHVRSIGGMSKIDYAVNDRHSINGFAFFGAGDRLDGIGTQASNRYRTKFIQTARMYAGTWTWLPSAAVANSFRVGYASLDQPNFGLDVLEGFTAGQLGVNTGVTRFGMTGVPEGFSVSGFYGIGSRETDLQGPGRTIEINDSVSYLVGNHALKFGGSVVRDIQNVSINANGRGSFTWGLGSGGGGRESGLPGLIVGQGAIPTTPVGVDGIVFNTNSGSQNSGLDDASLLYGDPYSKALRWNYSAFIQDDWRIKPRLTLNLGLRYDISSVLTTSQKYLGTVDPTLPGGIAQENINTDRIYDGDHNNFGPRVGFAWDMFGNGRTVLNAGGSIVFELMTLRTYLEVGNDLGLAGPPSGWVTGCTVDPSSLSSTITNPAAFSNCEDVGGVLTTPGGNRRIGDVEWAAGDDNILGNILWDVGSFAGVGAGETRVNSASTIFPDPNSVRLNCHPDIVTRDVAGGTPREGGQCTNIPGIDRNFRAPYVETWTLGLQHAIVNNVVLNVSYVGNHGVNLEGKANPNQPVTGSAWGLISDGITAVVDPNGLPSAITRYNNCQTQQRAGGGTCSTSDSARNTTLRPLFSQFPWMGNIVQITNGDVSNYNALQTALNVRNFHGLTMVSSYTWSHSLEMSSNNNSGLGRSTYIRSLDYGTTNGSVSHKFSLSPTYTFPAVSGYGGLLDGWKINGIFRTQSGRHLAFSQNSDYAGTGRNSNTWDLSGSYHDFQTDYSQNVGLVRNPELPQFYPGCSVSKVTDPNCNTLPSGTNPRTGVAYVAADMAVNNQTCTANAASVATLRAFGCWVQGNSTLTPPALGTFGNARKDFTGLPVWLLDFSVAKRQRLTERFSAEFRAEVFNIFNHPIFNQPSGAIGTSCTQTSCGFMTVPGTTPDVGSNNPIVGSGGPRRFQLGMKISF